MTSILCFVQGEAKKGPRPDQKPSHQEHGLLDKVPSGADAVESLLGTFNLYCSGDAGH